MTTQDRYHFFAPEESLHVILCDLFIKELHLAKNIKDFKLFAFTIMYDHIHLLIKPGKKYNVSKCMFSIKKNFSHDVNRVLGINQPYTIDPEGEQTFVRLHQEYINSLIKKKKIIRRLSYLPRFKWQRSFHDHVIRNQKDFDNHFNYIANNHLKHSDIYDYPTGWEYVYPNEDGNTFNELIDMYE